MLGLGLSLPAQSVAVRNSLVVTQSNPLFYDPADSTNTTVTGRTGWTRAGDATKGDKIKSANDMFRMNTGTNGDSPYGFQVTAAPGQFRRVTFGYDYSEQGGTLTNSATPRQFHDQRWILAYQDTTNYLFAAAFSVSAGVMQMRIYRCVNGVDTEICRYMGLPAVGVASFTLTDRIRLIVGTEVRAAEVLHTDPQAAWPDKLFSAGTTNAMRSGNTALRHTFHPLILALDWKVEELDMTVADPALFYGEDTDKRRAITFSGTYSGTPVSWVYRLRRRSTGVTVKDWAAFTPTAGAGAWSASISIASGGPYFMDVGWTDGAGKTHLATSSSFGVGYLIVMWGQSLAVGGSAIGGAGAASGNDTVIGYNGFAQYAGSSFDRWVDDTLVDIAPSNYRTAMVPSMIGLAKRMTAALAAAGDNTPVGVAAIGQASQALADLKPGTTYWNTVLVPFIAKLGGKVSQWQLEQGQAETLSSSSYVNWSADFDLCVAGFRSLGGIPNAPVLLRITGKDTAVANNSTTIARSSAMRSIQNSKHNPAAGIRISCFDADVPLSDTIHPTAGGGFSLAERDGLSHACVKGAIAYDGRGPMLSTATRSGSVITLPIDANGATSFTGSALTGYVVSNDDFVTSLPTTSVEIVGTDLKITVTGSPGGTWKVRSFPEPNYADSSLARGVYANGMTIPFYLIADPITVT